VTITDTDDSPAVDERDPASLVPAAVDEVLRLAATWLAWDGAPRFGDGNAWTPHKALRRVADHLLDHLAEIEALLAGAPTVPDHWHASAVTLGSDLAPFTGEDLNEAGERLRRLAQLYLLRFTAAGPAAWDEPRNPNWTLREIVEHVAPAWYAEAVGDLSGA
jgi:hypothetical protein